MTAAVLVKALAPNHVQSNGKEDEAKTRFMCGLHGYLVVAIETSSGGNMFFLMSPGVEAQNVPP